MSDIGHNSQIGGIAGEALRQYVSRIENLEAEKKALAEDVKDVYQQIKSAGLDGKIIRKIIALRKRDRQEREEEEQIMELYLAALGEA